MLGEGAAMVESLELVEEVHTLLLHLLAVLMEFLDGLFSDGGEEGGREGG